MSHEIVNVQKSNSFFQFISKYCLQEAGGNVNRAVHRLCSLMRKMGVVCAVVEDLEHSSPVISEEVSALRTYLGGNVNVSAHRITFLSVSLASLEDLSRLTSDAFLSSSVIINYKESTTSDWESYLFQSIVCIPMVPSRYGRIPLLNNYIHVFKTFECEICLPDKTIKKFNIVGSFFCQQNSKTSVCAHASLCMTINNMEGKGFISSEDINNIIGVDHVNIKMGDNGKSGLTKDEILHVLRQYGLSFTIKDYFSSNHEENYNDYIYKYLEGRYPALLVFTTTASISHVVPVLGHTLNSDMWRPEAELSYVRPENILNFRRPASAFVDHFIIHDDNFGMYFSLPADSLNKVVLPKHDPRFRILYAITIVPDGVSTPSWEAEWASVVIADVLLKLSNQSGTLDVWCSRLASMQRPWVVRSFLLKKSDYSRSLDSEDFEGAKYSTSEKQEILSGLPDLFWLSEITLPDLYTANRTKILDVFYPSDCTPLSNNSDIFNRWIQVRAPYALLIAQSNLFGH